MAKRARSKSARQQKPRARRPVPRTQEARVDENGGAASSAVADTLPSRPEQPVRPARRPSAGRTAASTVINYNYLRRDILTVGVLAPAMVILLLIAFFVLR